MVLYSFFKSLEKSSAFLIILCYSSSLVRRWILSIFSKDASGRRCIHQVYIFTVFDVHTCLLLPRLEITGYFNRNAQVSWLILSHPQHYLRKISSWAIYSLYAWSVSSLYCEVNSCPSLFPIMWLAHYQLELDRAVIWLQGVGWTWF